MADAMDIKTDAKKRTLAPEPAEGSDFISLEVPAKRQKIFEDDLSADDGDNEVVFKINKDFARRFEHRNKRKELHMLEEKYGKDGEYGNGQSDDESSSEESEDDDGILATEELDQEILATLTAIRSQDPRVYDKSSRFYSDFEPAAETERTQTKEKTMTLKDYHLKNLLSGETGESRVDAAPMSYVKQQEDLKRSLIQEMHGAAGEDDEDDDEDFLKPTKAAPPPLRPAVPDPTTADEDPDKFLTEFLASRAWVPAEGSRFAALESDEDEQFEQAEEFEMKYNLRFEDPEEINKTLVTYARDAIAEKSVRREDKSARKRAKEKEREKKEAARQEREQERARLRKLKIDQMETKAQMIRETAGFHSQEFKIEEWADVLDADWDDERWGQEMKRRFGEDYYQDGDDARDSDDEQANAGQAKKKAKKPKWDEDIDINDLVPDFNESETVLPALHLSDEDDAAADSKTGKSKKKARSAKADAKAEQRRDRRIITALVDQAAPLDHEQPGAKISQTFRPFRYRETSPGSFGLTPLDILVASDAQLNEFVGLKKLAAFRDPERKRKDKKRLAKKAKLRQWRKDTFGSEDGPKREMVFAPVGGETDVNGREDAEKAEGTADPAVDVREGERRKKKGKKRGRKGKEPQIEA